MGKVCEIQGIEPFNEVFYKDCYFNSLFSVMNYFQLDISYVLINDIFHYELLNQAGGLRIRYQEIRSVNEILEEGSIRVECQLYSNNIIEDIKNAICQKIPVILAVDGFYCPNIIDIYQKKHILHTLLIVGFDDTKKIFSIIDLEVLNNLTYKKFIISYEQLIRAHRADLVVLNQEKGENTIFFYSETTGSCPLPEVRFVYLDNLRLQENIVWKGMEDLEKFIQNYKSLCYSEKSYVSKELLDCFVEVFNSKKVELYRLQRIFGTDHQLTIAYQQLQEKWKHIMTQYGLYHYSSKKQESVIFQISACLREAVQLEKKVLSKLLLYEEK